MLDLAVSIKRLEESLRELTEDERLLDRSRPVWWARLLQTEAAKLHRVQVIKNASAQLKARRHIRELMGEVDREIRPNTIAAADQLRRAEEELKRAESEERDADERFEAAKMEFAFLPFPDRLEDLQTDQ